MNVGQSQFCHPPSIFGLFLRHSHCRFGHRVRWSRNRISLILEASICHRFRNRAALWREHSSAPCTSTPRNVRFWSGLDYSNFEFERQVSDESRILVKKAGIQITDLKKLKTCRFRNSMNRKHKKSLWIRGTIRNRRRDFRFSEWTFFGFGDVCKLTCVK